MRRDRRATYQYLLDDFGEEKIKSRTALLILTAKEFVKRHGIEQYIFINLRLIEQVIIDYFADIKVSSQ